MATTIPSYNFSSHPELSDSDFVTIAIYRFTGNPNFVWSTSAGATFSDNVQAVGSMGRQAWIESVFQNWGTGNTTDGWFYNVPPWSWAVVVPIVVIVAGILLWRAFGSDLTKMVPKGNGSSGYL